MKIIKEIVKISPKKAFTLIELIVTIVILGILAAIVIPNISSLKEDSIPVAVANNERTLQTAIDVYGLENNGALPTILQPTIEDPQPLDYNALYPKYLKSKPKVGHYLVDVTGKVWGSTSIAPNQINYAPNEFSFKTVETADTYTLFEYGETKVVNSKAKSSKYNLKEVVELPLEGEEFKDIYRVDNPDNKKLLVSAVDKFGLKTAPVGEEYLGIQDGLPIQGIGSFYLITDAHGKAVWDGIRTHEILPEGTSINYSFATSNDGKNYTEFISDIKLLGNSRYMKVKVEMASINETEPTLKMLKVIFHLADVEDEVTVHNPLTPIVIGSGKTTDTFTEIINLGSVQDIEKIELIGKESPGSSIESSYQSSTDGVTYSSPTPYPEELPDGQYIKVEIDLERINPTLPSPEVITIVVDNSEPKKIESGTVTVPEEEEADWQTISSLTIIEDATEIGDWISVVTEQVEPVGTRMIYRLSTSNDEVSWSEPKDYDSSINSISESNSRFLKVEVIKQREKGSTKSPTFTSITIDYQLLDGTRKTSEYNEEGEPVNNAVPLAKGAVVEYGEFNGKPLLWYVIKQSGNETMLFMTDTVKNSEGSDYSMPLNPTTGSSNWEQSEVRRWLNNDFYNVAFPDKGMISDTTHEYLLSIEESHLATSGSEVYTNYSRSTLEQVTANYDKLYKKTATDKIYSVNVGDLVKDIQPAIGDKWYQYSPSSGYVTSDAAHSAAVLMVSGDSLSNAGAAFGIRPAMSITNADVFKYGAGTLENPYRVEPFKRGGVVEYGEFNGQPLKWNIVKEESGNLMLLLSDSLKNTDGTYLTKAFDVSPNTSEPTDYDRTTYGSNNWKNSDIRNWLNNEFYNTAFSNKSAITDSSNDYILGNIDISEKTSGTEPFIYYDHYYYPTTPLQNYATAYKGTTTDKVFLPNIEELVNNVRPIFGGYSDSRYSYLLRDGDSRTSYTVRFVSSMTYIGNTVANQVGYNIRPAILINANNIVDPDGTFGTSAKPYTVK